MLIYAVGVCLFVPGTLLTGLGAAIFGAYWGFLVVWVGAMAGASAAFFMATIVSCPMKDYPSLARLWITYCFSLKK